MIRNKDGRKEKKPPVEQLVDADARKSAKDGLDQISKFGKDAILSMGSQPDQKSGCCFWPLL